MTGSMLYDTEENKTQVCDKDLGFNSKTKIKTIFIQVFYNRYKFATVTISVIEYYNSNSSSPINILIVP